MLARASILGCAALALLNAPVAHARTPSEDPSGELKDVRKKLEDKQFQKAVGGAMAAMTDAMLDMKTAPFKKAMKEMAKADPAYKADERDAVVDEDETLRDVAGPQAKDMPDRVGHAVPAMMSGMGAMTGAMEAMLPQLAQIAEAMGEGLKNAADQAAAKARSGS